MQPSEITVGGRKMDDQGVPFGAVATAVATAFATGGGIIRWLAVGRIEDLKSRIAEQREDIDKLRKSHEDCEKRCAEMSQRLAALEAK